MVTALFAPNKAKNMDRLPDGAEPCMICGKAIQAPKEHPFWVRTWFGSDIVTKEEAAALAVSEPGGDTGCYPVGRDCLRRNPQLKPYLLGKDLK